MKKTILTVVLALTAAFGFNAAAQTPGGADQSKPKTEKKADILTRDFEGINLTPDQKTKIEALNKNTVEKAKADMQKKKADKQQAKAEQRQAKQKAIAEKKQARENYLASIKSILTPEQYTKFLENNFVQKGKIGKAHCGHSASKANKQRNGKQKPSKANGA